MLSHKQTRAFNQYIRRYGSHSLELHQYLARAVPDEKVFQQPIPADAMAYCNKRRELEDHGGGEEALVPFNAGFQQYQASWGYEETKKGRIAIITNTDEPHLDQLNTFFEDKLSQYIKNVRGVRQQCCRIAFSFLRQFGL